jgi:ferritin-like metal-binding protein YciE
MKNNNDQQSHTELHELFVDQLKDILWAEKQLVKALPKMAEAAQSEDLRDAFANHQSETEGHVSCLGSVFESIGVAPRALKCEAMAGLLKEGEEIMKDYRESPASDAALIAAAQKVEHYEIATYGTLRAFARLLDYKEAEKMLGQILEEEAAADEKLTSIALQEANQHACAAA